MTDQQAAVGEEVLYCTVHPDRATTLRCNRCGRPMCTHCAVRTPVGYRCRECVHELQGGFYNAANIDYLIAGVVAIVLGGIGAAIVRLIGFFFLAFFISPAAGALIGDLIHRAVGRRRGRYTWLVAAGGIVVGALLLPLIPALLSFMAYSAAASTVPEAEQIPVPLTMFLAPFANINLWIYLVLAPGAAVGVLRVGRGRFRLGR